ncbi:MAG: PsiF repeat-containing protein [Dokdonella sp.]|uniref:PsiF family protein n=1 Tax=Dokdonella sp. TaxID=2291710 RepID=UPI0027B9826B|nr:PsiF family protein [Dokdonella sp.]MCW5578589.1 PsiF repeat-containing protein [Dokdonella sp.]
MQSKTISLFALALVLAIGAGVGHAEETTKTGKPLTVQQARMKSCNAQAKADGLKGDARKSYLSSCLKGQGKDAAADAAPAPVLAKAPSPKQEQRKACGAEAKAQGIKGDERKAFVKQCMQRPLAASAEG